MRPPNPDLDAASMELVLHHQIITQLLLTAAISTITTTVRYIKLGASHNSGNMLLFIHTVFTLTRV